MTASPTDIERIYAVSDVHGHLEAFKAALTVVNLEGDSRAELVLLGVYVDRGPHSAQVLQTIRELQQGFGDRVTALLGNHDDWLLGWLDGDDSDLTWLMTDAGFVTIKSFLEPLELAHALGHDDPSSDASSLDGWTLNRNLKRAIRGCHAGLITWLRGLPRVYETDTQIFVHAGVDEEAGGLWSAATPEYVLTEKYPATVGPFHKTIIAGHVRTSELHPDMSHGVFHDGESHYYIDGQVEHTGKLNVLRYTVVAGEYDSRRVGAGGPDGPWV